MSISPSHDGHIIEDQYEYLGNLGSGSHGQVIKVLDHRLKRICALKFYRDTNSGAGTWREAQVLQSLRGNYILPVHGAGLAEGVPFIVTDIAAHGDLDGLIPAGVGLTVKESTRLIREACHGIVRIHDHGMVHRDIKPSNLFLDEKGKVLVGDLGTASILDDKGVAFPHGTRETMAPEVSRSCDLSIELRTKVYSVRSDVYSLGATLWWMLGGAPPPGRGDSRLRVGNEFDLWSVAPHVPQGLRRIVHKAMSSDPSDRYSSVSELDAALGSFQHPAREWKRIARHDESHVECFVGEKGNSGIAVCAKTTESDNEVQIEVSYLRSGRRRSDLSRRTRPSRLDSELRSTFRACK